MAFPFDQINAAVNLITAPIRSAVQNPPQITPSNFANPVQFVTQSVIAPILKETVQRVATPPQTFGGGGAGGRAEAKGATQPTPSIVNAGPPITPSYGTVTIRQAVVPQQLPVEVPEPEQQQEQQQQQVQQQELPRLPVPTGDIDNDTSIMCNTSLPYDTRMFASFAVNSWLESKFRIREKISQWKSQGYDTSNVENLFEGPGGWTDIYARVSGDPTRVGELCGIWSSLISGVQNMSGAAPTGPDNTQVEKIFARGIGIIMPNYVIEGSKTNVKAFITRHISQEQGTGEPTVTIIAGGQKLAEVQTVNRTADITIDIPVGAKYYKVCASSSIGGQDCKTVKVMKEVPNIAELVAAENTLLEALKSAITSRNIISATPVTTVAVPQIPEISLPELPSGATVEIPQITLPEKATEPVQIYIDGKPYGNPPLSINLSAGKHIITASLKGFSDINKTIRVAEGAKVVIPEITFG